MAAHAAVIFDVDGVLLDLTGAEEDTFFAPFRQRYGLTGLSRDWDSYRIRNDADIAAEILEINGLPVADLAAVLDDYVETLRSGLLGGGLSPVEIPGARSLLGALAGRARLGIATANLRTAAQLRLEIAGLWTAVASHAFGADGGGHKRDILARAIASTGLPPDRIVYIGDNLNDLDAGRANGVHFIGFATAPARRDRLAAAGAERVSGDHAVTRAMIAELLRFDDPGPV